MNIKSTIDSIIPERKENGQILTTGEVAEILVANRLHHSLPMKDIKLWAEVCGIKELFDIEPHNLNDDRIARGLDDLAQYFEEIETKLSINIIREFNLNPEEILWDTTSIYFEGDYDEAEIVQFGYGDKPDLKQIKLALNVEKDSGVPLRGSVIKGNLNDPSIVVENMKKLRNHLNKQDILFTGDKYAQKQVDNCFQGPKSYLRIIFGNPTVEEKDGQLQLVYSIDKELLAELEKQDGLYPVVTVACTLGFLFGI
jgi:transposase